VRERFSVVLRRDAKYHCIFRRNLFVLIRLPKNRKKQLQLLILYHFLMYEVTHFIATLFSKNFFDF